MNALNEFFVTKPYDHQLQVFMATRNKEYFAPFLDQGLGKTKITIDTARWLWMNGKITGLLIVAPSGIHEAWVAEQFPLHAKEGEYRSFVWENRKTQKEERELRAICAKSDRLAVYAVNIEALRLGKGKPGAGFNAAKRFLDNHKTLMVVDESTIIKNPSAQQTRGVLELGKLAAYRRILTGTPATERPIDVFSQIKFLRDNILPYGSFTAFCRDFVEEVVVDFGRGSNSRSGGSRRKQIVGFRNLNKLRNMLEPHSIRLTKEDCLDLPPKTYTKEPVPLTDEQKEHYAQMANAFRVQLQLADGEPKHIQVNIGVAALAKLAQISAGFILDEDQRAHELKNNRITRLIQMVGDHNDKVVIFSHFRHSAKMICRALEKEFGHRSVVQYTGEVTQEERIRSREAFQNKPEVRFFVGSRPAYRGLNLQIAHRVVYYSNGYSLEDRLQSEDRVQRIGQTKPVTITDMVAPGTVDVKILTSHLNKRSVMEEFMGDWRNWL